MLTLLQEGTAHNIYYDSRQIVRTSLQFGKSSARLKTASCLAKEQKVSMASKLGTLQGYLLLVDGERV